jgi:hypothetical protein
MCASEGGLARHVLAVVVSITPKLTWRYDNITSMLAADRDSAEKLLAAFKINE